MDSPSWVFLTEKQKIKDQTDRSKNLKTEEGIDESHIWDQKAEEEGDEEEGKGGGGGGGAQLEKVARSEGRWEKKTRRRIENPVFSL